MSERNLPQAEGVGTSPADELNLPEDALEVVAAEVAASEAEEAAGSCACTLFAVVNSNGTLARGFRAVRSRRVGLGSYEVIFNRNVRACAYVATIGLSGSVGVSPPGQISVVGRVTDVNGVFVATTNSAGANADLGFHLAVHCRP